MSPGERRQKRRYAIDLPLAYKIMRNYLVIGTGMGSSMDISSGGVALRAGNQFKPGTHIELSVSWPALLNGDCPMQLLVEGRVVRSNDFLTAICLDRYEFRTQRRSDFIRAAKAEGRQEK